jgi:hypothetical protein
VAPIFILTPHPLPKPLPCQPIELRPKNIWRLGFSDYKQKWNPSPLPYEPKSKSPSKKKSTQPSVNPFNNSQKVSRQIPMKRSLIIPIMSIRIHANPLGVLHILGIRCPKLTCINLMDPTQQGGSLKWNNTSSSILFGMMRPKYMYGFFTWIKNDGSGGNDIRNVIQDYPLVTCSLKKFVPLLIGNHIFWVGSPSYTKLDQSHISSLHLNSWISRLRDYLMHFTLNVLSMA